MKELNFIHPDIFVARAAGRGRGVFCRKAIDADTLIETAPVIVMTGTDRLLLDQTLLHDYIFEWGAKSDQCCMALGYVPLYNHSYQSNCIYEMDFKKSLISITSVHRIKKGEELFINYNGDWDNAKKVWFDKSE